MQERTMPMAQLIKLQNYISRYENDLFHYPARFFLLKKQEWEKFQANWVQQKENVLIEPELKNDDWLAEEVKEKTGLFRSFFSKKEKQLPQKTSADLPEEETILSLTETESLHLHTVEDAKKAFLEKMYSFQIKWASSTLFYSSRLDHKYYVDEKLKFLLKRLPDTFLILYEPVFRFQKAVVEMDIIMLTPTDVWCITFLEEQNDAVFIGTADRFWSKRHGETETKILSPIVPLSRMETLVKKILEHEYIDISVKKAVLSRNGYIDYLNAPGGINYIDKREFTNWFTSMRSMVSPLKNIQLRAAKALLEHADSVSARRPEWEEEEL